MKLKELIYSVVAVVMTACTTENYQNGDCVPLRVNGCISSVSTHTRVDYTQYNFDDGALIGIYNSSDELEQHIYKYDAANKSFNPSAEDYYLTNTTPVPFYGIYPVLADDAVDDSGNVVIETGGVKSDGSSVQCDELDYLYASGKASMLKNELNLVFGHTMSKITINLVPSSDIDYSNFEGSAKISGLSSTGKFNLSEGIVSPVESSTNSDIIFPAFTTVTNSNSEVEYITGEVIVVPQSLTTSGLCISVNYAGLDYDANVSASSLSSLEAGYDYVFNVTIAKTGLVVNTVAVAAWNNVSDNFDMEYTEVPPYSIVTNKADVRKFDIVLEDGTFIHIDGDTNDEILENLALLPDAMRKSCRGIVFWTKSEEDGSASLEDDNLLMLDYADCKNGLIISLENGCSNDIYQFAWSSYTNMSFEDYGDEITYKNIIEGYNLVYRNFQEGGAYGRYPYQAINYINQDKILGYNNTAVLRAYNSSRSFSYNFRIGILDAIPSGNVANCSSWYIPSCKELSFFCDETFITQISNMVKLICGEDYTVDKNEIIISSGGGFWSSTEGEEDYGNWYNNYSSDNAFYMYIYKSYYYPDLTIRLSSWQKSETRYVRPICAF